MADISREMGSIDGGLGMAASSRTRKLTGHVFNCTKEAKKKKKKERKLTEEINLRSSPQ